MRGIAAGFKEFWRAVVVEICRDVALDDGRQT
jgi:hypothetical protein